MVLAPIGRILPLKWDRSNSQMVEHHCEWIEQCDQRLCDKSKEHRAHIHAARWKSRQKYT